MFVNKNVYVFSVGVFHVCMYSPSPERRFGKSVRAVRHSIHLSGRTARSLPAFGNKNSARPCMDAIRMAWNQAGAIPTMQKQEAN